MVSKFESMFTFNYVFELLMILNDLHAGTVFREPILCKNVPRLIPGKQLKSFYSVFQQFF